ncbi:DUF1828 domain-containing protein [Mogibacterium sp. NSJ-24]|jgi:hypothetical protein|uniref:DUF1828 domain-containing protein n=1 Tax=Lentihominibacter hominis TaxID=2763645 RepID=A0A926E9H9_9FIRM|nr:DUF1828 domain-containing protein [Lentihominibacter hominis]MBC8568209.1 DUF1828 domain-containing protein [Lentihominibacter hominis]
MDINNLLQNTPGTLFRAEEQNNGIYQLIAPLFHEDGDMMSIYIEESNDGNIKIFDNGMSLMRLSYTFDIDTDNKAKILNDIILAKNAENYEGNICLTVSPEQIYTGIMTYSQLVNQICGLDILSRESIADLFYENLSSVIENTLTGYIYDKDVTLPEYREMKIDYVFRGADKPIYLFGVKDTNKAQQTTICCLQLAQNNIPFKSVAVFNNLDNGIITKFARNTLMNTVGKVFSDLDGFKEHGQNYFKSEIA